MRKLLLTLAIAASSILSFGQEESQVFRETIFFESASYELSESDKSKIGLLLENISEGVKFELTISAHTDSVGSISSNQKLAERRASSVIEYFKTKNLSSGALNYKAYGESKPLEKDHRLSQQRRVELILSVEAQKVDQKEKHPKQSISELYKELEPEPQKFCIDDLKDTVLSCNQGTLLYFKANSFNRVPTGESDCISIEVREVFRKSDMIRERLTTTSHGQTLVSQGMIKVDAFIDDVPVSLNPGVSYKVFMPTDTIVDRASLFDGHRDPQGEINWTENNSDLQNFDLSHVLPCYEMLVGASYSCPFFFCKIRRFFNFSGRFRESVSYTPSSDTLRFFCNQLDSLFDAYGVTNRKQLADAMNRELYEKYGVDNAQDLREALAKERREKIEVDFKDGKLPFRDFQYYAFESSDLNWKNVDYFADFKDLERVKMNVDLEPAPNVDVKLVFKTENIILPASGNNTKFFFKEVPKGMEAWLVALKLDGKKCFVSMTKVTIDKKVSPVEFEEVSLEELKQRLKALDEV